MHFIIYLRGDLYPVPVAQRSVVLVNAGETHELDIGGAAGHGEAAGHKAVLARLRGFIDLGEETHGLPVIFLRLVLAVEEPDPVVLVAYFYNVGVYVEGEGVGYIVVLDAAVAYSYAISHFLVA